MVVQVILRSANDALLLQLGVTLDCILGARFRLQRFQVAWFQFQGLLRGLEGQAVVALIQKNMCGAGPQSGILW